MVYILIWPETQSEEAEDTVSRGRLSCRLITAYIYFVLTQYFLTLLNFRTDDAAAQRLRSLQLLDSVSCNKTRILLFTV